ncbi:hypothetical protein GCM10009122_48150 [Fulvivirga kasyanovii]|uniref:sensor histidine kinase n=1 Tax=Fulvivirga kasyanovii TaxID=396812 RepID=UPI0031D8662B
MSDSAILLVGSLGMSLLIIAILLFAFLYQSKIKRKNEYIQEIKNLLHSMELAATNSYILGQNEEKRIIAQELHDGIGSELMVLKLKLNTDDEVSQDLKRDIDKIMARIRGVSHNLYKGMFTYENLDIAIENYVNAIDQHTNLEIAYTSYGLSYNDSNSIGTNIFRIVQELFQNTLKHARATKALLDINFYPSDQFNIIYSDNGVGIDQHRVKEGIGLRSLRERVAVLNGIIDLRSEKGKGIEVIINCDIS